MAILIKVLHRFNTFAIKISASFFAEIDKKIYNFKLKFKGPRIAKAFLKKNKMRGLTLYSSAE